jgi:hypothetical protein
MVKQRPFSLKSNDLRTVLMFGDCGEEGLYWVQPMRFLWPSEAKRELNAKFPQMCHHICGHRSRREVLR